MVLLNVCNLGVRIGEKRVCDGLNLKVEKGQRWAIMGCNGVGKSTLLHTLAGLYPFESGEIHIHNQPLNQCSRRSIAQSMGVLLQESTSIFPSTVLETALTGRHPFVSPWRGESEEDYKRVYKALQHTGLEGLEHRLITTLSGGEKRRLELAVLLVQSPQLFLMDEPTNHLDLHHQMAILNHLHLTASKVDGAWITVLHDINLAARFCDYFLFLFGEGQSHQGGKEEMLQERLLHKLYGHPLFSVQHKGDVYWIPK